jgi:hypothetical protein
MGLRADLDRLVELRGASGETCLFGEGPGGFVVAGDRSELDALAAEGLRRGVDVLAIGDVGGGRFEIWAAEAELSVDLARAERAWLSLRPA